MVGNEARDQRNDAEAASRWIQDANEAQKQGISPRDPRFLLFRVGKRNWGGANDGADRYPNYTQPRKS